MDGITILAISAPTVAAIAAFGSSLVSNKRLGESNRRLDEVHKLVNSRLSEALTKIDVLEKRVFNLTGELPTGEPLQRHTP